MSLIFVSQTTIMKRAARGSGVKGKQFKLVKWLPFYDIVMVEKDGTRSSPDHMQCSPFR
jgi:hypothetical protein